MSDTRTPHPIKVRTTYEPCEGNGFSHITDARIGDFDTIEAAVAATERWLEAHPAPRTTLSVRHGEHAWHDTAEIVRVTEEGCTIPRGPEGHEARPTVAEALARATELARQNFLAAVHADEMRRAETAAQSPA